MKTKKVRIPDSNELWRNSNDSYYYVVKNGRLYRLCLELDSRDVYKLLEGIKNIHISKSESCDKDVLDGVDFWKFVHENWRKYIKTMIHEKITKLQKVLNECVQCAKEI